ncbi:CD209 antigen-like protein E isoform X3 [Thunnus maccoyii]|uniref:CD209 antigen-like protein E isoform X3 n=1 Tax=Thunnus maccoyii TaxID=8240 RepID=UPI001C4CC091|nr:CD209 antigen-like protein E isoform X3 [Thunnus maccoyii]
MIDWIHWSLLCSGPRSSERRFYRAVVLCLGLLSVFLLAGLIGLGVHYHYSVQHSAEELSTVKANLTKERDLLNTSIIEMTKERDLLNASIIEKTKEQNRLISLEERTCPTGWRLFRCACYLLSNESGSWEEGRKDCRDRGANLVVIDSAEEQKFLSNFAKEGTQGWIGLTDRVKEKTWEWTDGSQLSVKYWRASQPDNGGGYSKLGEEDCAHIITGGNTLMNWNDLSCDTSLRWICEKKV